MTGPSGPRLLFVGFHGTSDGSTPTSQNEIVAGLLEENGFSVRSGSAKVGQLTRFADQLWIVFRSLAWADVIVVDVFSGRRIWTPFVIARIARAAGVPLVLVLHGGRLPEFARDHSWRVESTLRLASTLVAPSGYLKRFFDQRGFDVRVIPNLVDLPKTAAESAPKSKAERVLWMRSFDVEYQPMLALEAFALLTRRHPAAELTMAGADRGLQTRVQQRARELRLGDRVRFPGYLRPVDKVEALHASDVFLNTTSIDNTPVSVLEAMASGVPVVATDVGGMADLLEGGEAGVLVPNGDALALARALEEVLEDDLLRCRLIQRGAEVASRFSGDAVVDAWRSVVAGVGGRSGSLPHDGCALLALGDLDEVVAIHRAAFPNSAMTLLGIRVVRLYYRWQFAGPHPNPVAVGVWRDGRLVGFLFGGSRKGAVSGFVRASLPALSVGLLTHPQAIRQLALPKVLSVARAMRRHRSPAPDIDIEARPAVAPMASPSFGVLSVAVVPSQRGSGAAGELLGLAERLARGSGYRGMHLTVDAANSRAIAFYRKYGWLPTDAAEEGSLLMVKLFGDE